MKVEVSQHVPGLNIKLLATSAATENRAAALVKFKKG